MLHYRDEIQIGVLQTVFWFDFGEASPPSSDERVSFEWRSRHSATPLLSGTLAYDADTSRWEARPDTSALSSFLDMEVYLQRESAEGVSRFIRPASLLPDPWSPLVTLDDLAAFVPAIRVELRQAEVPLQRLLAVCEDEVRLRFRERGYPAGALQNKAALDTLLRLRTIAAYLLRREASPDAHAQDHAAAWARRAEQAFQALVGAPQFVHGLEVPPSLRRPVGPMRLSP